MVAFLPRERLKSFLDLLAARFSVFVPIRTGNSSHFRPYSGAVERIDFGAARAIQPLKTFFFPCRERVAEGFSGAALGGDEGPICIVGAKACDLRALRILDAVFLESEPVDPYYARRRRNSFVIASECARPLDTCFCSALDGAPYPRDGFDAVLAEIASGWLLEMNGAKGALTFRESKELTPPATESQLMEREAVRRRAIETIEVNLSEHGVPRREELRGVVAAGYDAPVWQEEAGRCVECGACNTICPTCHCFYLHEYAGDGVPARIRSWDSCLFNTFARVAGGGNPRRHLWMRLRNRFEKKFDFFDRTLGEFACTGCGRCIAACPAGIDIRRVLRELVRHAGSRESIPAR